MLAKELLSVFLLLIRQSRHSLGNHVTLCKSCHDRQAVHLGRVEIDDLPDYQRRILGGSSAHKR